MATLGGVKPKLTKVIFALLLMLLPALSEAEGLLRIGLQLHNEPQTNAEGAYTNYETVLAPDTSAVFATTSPVMFFKVRAVSAVALRAQIAPQ